MVKATPGLLSYALPVQREAGPLAEPLVRAAGSDISKWCPAQYSLHKVIVLQQVLLHERKSQGHLVVAALIYVQAAFDGTSHQSPT